MLFNSLAFFVYFAVVYTLYRVLPWRGQNAMLLVAGYVFYGWWDVRFLFLIAFSTTADFAIGALMADGRIAPRQRIVASCFIVAAAFFFACLRWRSGAFLAIDTVEPFSRLGTAALGITVVAVALVNGLHDRIGALPPERRRRLLLFTTVFVNLGFLGTFKYFDFFVGGVSRALEGLGLDPLRFHLGLLLPVGISFYTFQSLSYTIDVSRGRVAPVRRFLDFALFVAFFPPMVAGPIERARHLLPQLLRPRTLGLKQSSQGVLLILYGLFKKVAIADGLAVPVNAVFDSTGAVSSRDVALATVLFAFQILCDFSGYTDIARGVAKLLGFELMINFRLPYFARNPAEFWRRWHISLSTWLRDYLYIGLGGSRRGPGRTYVNLMTTMTLGGLWHGAAWNYVLWGVYQGGLLCAHRWWSGRHDSLPTTDVALDVPVRRRSVWRRHAGDGLRTLLLFAFVCYGWLLFRSTSFGQVVAFTQALASHAPAVASVIPRPSLPALLGLVLFVALQFADRADGRAESFRYWPRPAQALLYAAMLFVLTMGASNAPAQFIYFQF